MSVTIERKSSARVEERLQRWLAEEGFSVEKLGGANTTYNFWVTKNGLPSFSIFQPKDKHDVVYVESGVTFSGFEKEVSRVIANKNYDLAWKLKSLLYSKGFASFGIQSPDLRLKKPGGIIFAKAIYYDGLSKDRFLETTCQILSTVKVIVLTLQRCTIRQTANTADRNHSSRYVA